MKGTSRLSRHDSQYSFQTRLSFSDACIEDIEYHADRKLDKGQITRLSACNYVQEKHNLIILGASGAGYDKFIVM
jgi:hypothetical protein